MDFILFLSNYLTITKQKKVNEMPETLEGRERIIQYLNANDITIADLAAMYGIAKQDMSDYLSGRKKNPRGNKIILKIISDFKIR